MEEGKKIGRIARSLFLHGRLIHGDRTGELTQQLIDNPAISTIFEASIIVYSSFERIRIMALARRFTPRASGGYFRASTKPLSYSCRCITTSFMAMVEDERRDFP